MSTNENDWPDQTDIAYFMPMLEEEASKAAVIIELGCGHGNGSTRAFVKGLERSTSRYRQLKQLISVDHDMTRPECRPDVPYWHLVHGDTRVSATVDKVRILGLIPDIIFIDTDHTYDQMEAELAVWSILAAPYTLWLFHDTWMNDTYNDMVRAVEEFAAENGWRYEEISKLSHGMGRMVWAGGKL